MAESARDILSAVRKHVLSSAHALAHPPLKTGVLAVQVPAAIKGRDRPALEQAWSDLKAGIAHLQTQVVDAAVEGNELWLKATLMPDWAEQAQYFSGLDDNLRIVKKGAEHDIETLRKLQAAAGKALKAFKDADAELARQIGELELLLDGGLQHIQGWAGELTPLAQQAREAADQRKAPALDTARRHFEAIWLKFDAAYVECCSAHGQFPAQHMKGTISADQAARARQRHAALKKSVDTMCALWTASADARKSLAKLAAAPVDGHKASAVLEIDDRHAAALAEALQGDETQVQKKLDALGKRLKGALSGKEMFARLRKARLA